MNITKNDIIIEKMMPASPCGTIAWMPNQACPDRIDYGVKIREIEVSDCRCCGEISGMTK
jgi:hypothetical protein